MIEYAEAMAQAREHLSACEVHHRAARLALDAGRLDDAEREIRAARARWDAALNALASRGIPGHPTA